MSDFSRVLAVIPARFGSTRLPAKPLADILGKPMIYWVYSRAKKALPRVIVATDDSRIEKVVKGFGGEVMMTPRRCKSGTDRMACVARRIRADYYVNIQGDEPLIDPSTVKGAVSLALAKKAIATPVIPLHERDANNPNVVKVALGAGHRALYFSRAAIPFPRDGRSSAGFYKHLGLYVYPKKELFQFVKMRPTALEQTEKLEQLRALYYGLPIYVSVTKHDSIGVDTAADLKAVIKILKMSSETKK